MGRITLPVIAMADLDWQDSAPDITDRPSTLSPGRWYMRNGHLALLKQQVDIPYKDSKGEQRTYRIWTGKCLDCNTPMSWTFHGTYAAIGRHRSDIVGKEKPRQPSS